VIVRRSTDQLYSRAHDARSFGPSSLGLRRLSPRETEALRMVTKHPGISVAGMGHALGLGEARTGQIVARLEVRHIRRDGEPPAPRGSR
jgi:hypothetical protein